MKFIEHVASSIAHGDLYVSGDQRVVEHYLVVFKKFHNLGHYSDGSWSAI